MTSFLARNRSTQSNYYSKIDMRLSKVITIALMVANDAIVTWMFHDAITTDNATRRIGSICLMILGIAAIVVLLLSLRRENAYLRQENDRETTEKQVLSFNAAARR